MTRLSRRLRLLAGIALFTGCSGVTNLDIPAPPATQPLPDAATTTPTAPLTGVNLAPVPTGAPRPVVLTPGQSSLTGIVTGPSGPVGGATVLVEKLVGDAVGAKAVPTQPDGTWKLTGILGGRYRVRAWHVPDLALTTPQILLLGAKDNQNLALSLLPYNGQSVTATVAPSPPQVGQAATLFIQATQQAVGGDGVVRGAALPGASVSVVAAGNVVLGGNNPGTTDSGGRFSVTMTCASIGPPGLSATLNSLNSFPLTVPDCGFFVPPVVTVPPGSTTTVTLPTSSVP